VQDGSQFLHFWQQMFLDDREGSFAAAEVHPGLKDAR